MTPQDKLSVFLSADEAPAFDPVFIAQLGERMARVRLFESLRRIAVWAIAATAIGYGLYAASGPSLIAETFGFAGELVRTPGLMLAALTVVAGLWLRRWLPRRLVR